MMRLPFTMCLGLDNRSAPMSLAYSPQTGVYAAGRLVNCDVVDGGRRIKSCPGYTLALAGDFDNVPFTDAGRVYVASGDSLCRVVKSGATLALLPLVSGLTVGARLAWTKLGPRVFWSNGVQKGLFDTGEPKPWGGQPFSSDPREAAEYLSPPAGTVLAGFAGRIWIGVDDLLSFTVPGRWNHVKAGFGSLRQSSQIRMIQAVDDGFYVGTDDRVTYQAGFDPGALRQVVVSDDPPVPGAYAPIRSEDVTGKFAPSGAALWLTRGGNVVLGLPGGICMNLTKNRVAFDATPSWGAALVLDKRVVFTLRA
jgi:hypothetical protein